ncbi:MAG: hypothetical protein RIE83_14100 [Thalassobaculaceae bacterium]
MPSLDDGGFFDGLWNTVRGVANAAVDYIGAEREWDRFKWMAENGYADGSAPGGTPGYGTINAGGNGAGGMLNNTTLLVGGGLALVLLFVALRK